MAAARGRDYFQRVKHKKIARAPISKTPGTSPAEKVKPGDADFAAATSVPAKKSYSSHVNQGFSQGHEAQHWLEAEAKLNAERKLHRVKFLH
jgi:hypothetical protein